MAIRFFRCVYHAEVNGRAQLSFGTQVANVAAPSNDPVTLAAALAANGKGVPSGMNLVFESISNPGADVYLENGTTGGLSGYKVNFHAVDANGQVLPQFGYRQEFVAVTGSSNSHQFPDIAIVAALVANGKGAPAGASLVIDSITDAGGGQTAS